MKLRTSLPRSERKRRGTRFAAVAVGLASAASALVASPGADAATETTNPIGVVCTEDTGTTTPTFTLSTKTGYILLPDASTSFMWGFSEGNGGFQHPSPVLCVNEGDQVTVILNHSATSIPDDVSIMFPGQENVLADGQPVGPEYDGAGAVTSLTDSVAPGGSITYTFTAGEPGTYLYESGTDSKKQVNMGLFGALIVRPTTVGAAPAGARYANNRNDSVYMASEEFMVLMSEIDPYLHQAVERGRYDRFDWDKYKPRYWLVNGRGFPDSIADNNASWLPNQPYGALAAITEFTGPGGDHPYPGMARYLNVGTETLPMHPHGNNGLVINRDGMAYEGPGGEDLSFEKFSLNLGPGQTWDVLFRWHDAENYDPVTNPVDVEIPSLANQHIGVFYSGSPYLGETQTLPTGTSTLNQCGEYYIISHNHALHQIVSWGANMTGPITYMRINPNTTACDLD